MGEVMILVMIRFSVVRLLVSRLWNVLFVMFVRL